MKTNLLLLDSYEDIENLIHFAFKFSEHYKQNLKIYYVFDFSWMTQTATVGATGYASSSIINAEKSISEEFKTADSKIRDIVANYLKKHSVSFPIDINVSRKNRIDIIKSELEENSDLMVLISNHQNYSAITNGLVTYPKLVEHVNCPVLIVPDNIEQSEMRNVVYATNYNPEDIQSLKHLSFFMKKSENFHLTIMHNEPDFNYREKLKWNGFQNVVQKEIGTDNIDFALIKDKDFISGLDKFASESNPDLLVILNEKKGFLKDLFTKSNTKNVLTHFDKPLLVYHEK